MKDRHADAPAALVPELPHGANGIPEATVEDDMSDDTLATTRSSRRYQEDMGYGTSSYRSHRAGDTLLSWFAFGAVIFGVIGAISGAMSSSRRRSSSWRARGDRYELTPPHGDKLHPQF